MNAYVHVYNTAMHQTVSLEKEVFADLEEARMYKTQLENEYGQIGCHDVKLFIELFPKPEEENVEEEFDSDEMEEEE